MRNSLFFLILVLTFATGSHSSAQTINADPTKPRRLEVLFLGDNGHHRPIDLVPVLMEAMGSKGINFTYTDKITDLSPKTLGKYDALLLYAYEVVPSAQASALLDFVAKGKGFLPIHIDDTGFENNPELKKLIGATTGEHETERVPAGLVNAQLDQIRDPNIAMRTHGKGRVFTTAYGHDERTWKQPEFSNSWSKPSSGR